MCSRFFKSPSKVQGTKSRLNQIHHIDPNPNPIQIRLNLARKTTYKVKLIIFRPPQQSTKIDSTSTSAWPSLPLMSIMEETAAVGKGKWKSFPGTPRPRAPPKGTRRRSISKGMGIRLCGAGGHGNCGGAWSRLVKPYARQSARSWPWRCTPSYASKEISMEGESEPTEGGEESAMERWKEDDSG